MNNLLEKLLLPFEPGMVEWKPGASKGDKCLALAFADLRVYYERLDEVVGMNWSSRFVPWTGKGIICELTIAGVTRSSTGEADAQDEKNGMSGSVSEAMSFKRACAAFGLGRYLYSLPSVWIDFDATSKRISKSGLTELEQRYSAWYAKTMAATAKRRPPSADEGDSPRVDPETGEILEGKPATDSLGDVLFQPDPERVLASQPQRNRMHALGMEYYKTAENWDKKRPEWVRDASGGAVESSNDLSPEQCEWVISLLELRLAKRAAANEQEPIATVA